MRKNPGVLAYLVCLMAGWSVWAQDWPQWRGPDRDGAMRFIEPKAWPEKLTSKWKVPVGDGYASPLFAGGRIFQFARQGNDEVAMSVDPETGKMLWRESYPAPYEPVQSAARHGKGPKSTPLYYDGRLYTFGISGILSSFDAATGKVEWRKEYAKDFKGTWPQFGTSMSPVAGDGVVVVLIGTNDDGAVAAYDAKSGAQKWIWKGDGPAYASPVIVEIEGVKQVVTLTQKYAVGLALASGDLLWRIDFPGRSGMNIPTPLRFGQRLILAGDPGTMLLAGEQAKQRLDDGKGLADFRTHHAVQLSGAKGQSDFRILQPEQRDVLLCRRRQRKDALDQRSEAGRQCRGPDFGRASVPVEG